MSKLTDKIAAELTRPHSDRHLATLQDILADVRELEQQATAWTTQQRYTAVARQAKREAYKHALSLVTKDSLDAATGNSKRVSYYRIHAALTGAIDALNTEGDDNE